VTTSDGLWSALKTAHAGDTVLLAPGTYSTVSLSNFHFDGTVTIQSADPTHEAVVNGIMLNTSSGLAFNNIELVANGTGTGATVVSSSNISLSGLTVHGDSTTPQGLGALVRDSSNVSISNSDFTQLGSGIAHLNSTNINFSNNTLHNLETDGIFGGGSTHVVVDGNQFTDFHPLTGDHPDAIQFWGNADGSPGSDIAITNNVITRGAGDPIQGVFIENSQNLVISGNAMTGTLFNGISLSTSGNASVENNLVQGATDMPSRIIVRDGSTNVTVAGNTITQDVVNLHQAGGADNVNFILGPNTTIGSAAVGDVSTLNAFVAQEALGKVVGTSGNDVLTTNGGADTMTGGAGADTFYFQKAPTGVNLITDFTHGQDTLDLHTLLANYHGTDPVADQWVKFQSDATGTTVYVDTDGPTGAGAYVAVAKLAGVTSLVSTDWVFH
jgi:parallel beta-helix repeat protein